MWARCYRIKTKITDPVSPSWFDADTVILNPLVPLETFLPPSDFDHIHFLGAKDWNGFNAGVFFIRINQWSVDMLVEVMAEPILRPDVDHPFLEQGDMARTFDKPKYRDNVLYQPRHWYNAYSKGDDDDKDPEVRLGEMQIHFPGLGGSKEQFMGNWLDKVETTRDWSKSLKNTSYSKEIPAFWGRLRDAKKMLDTASEPPDEPRSQPQNAWVKSARTELRRMIREEPYDVEQMQKAIKDLKLALEPPPPSPPPPPPPPEPKMSPPPKSPPQASPPPAPAKVPVDGEIRDQNNQESKPTG